jgi:hypothetical protein
MAEGTTAKKEGNKMERKYFEDKIVGKARIEGHQRGYSVWVSTKTRKKAILADCYDNGTTKSIDTAYNNACAHAQSINRGNFVTSRKGASIIVSGKVLKVQKDF